MIGGNRDHLGLRNLGRISVGGLSQWVKLMRVDVKFNYGERRLGVHTQEHKPYVTLHILRKLPDFCDGLCKDVIHKDLAKEVLQSDDQCGLCE